jgi:hypothetical protein
MVDDIGKQEKGGKAEGGKHTKAVVFYLAAADEQISGRKE